jgi:hypothetical protein
MADDHGDAAQTRRGDRVKRVLDEPAAVQRNHAFGRIAGQVTQAFSGTGGENDGLHEGLLGFGLIPVFT